MSNPELVVNQAKSAIENSISEAFERFQNEKFGTVRVVMRESEPWFVAKDPCDCLGYSDTSDACRVLDEDEKCVVSRKELPALFAETSSTPTMTLISESGLYTLILRSNKPEAKSFRKWVTSEVLPSIRKTGEYRIAPRNYAEALRALAAEVEAKEEAQRSYILEKEQHEADNRDFREGLDILNSKCAQIQTRQVQTALTTASIKSRECKRLTNENETLKEKLGDSANLKAVKSLPWLKEFFRFIDKTKWNALLGVVGREIGKICESNGFRKIRIDDPNWGEVWAYDIKAVEIFKGKLIQDLNYLRKYRIYQDA